MSDNVQNEKLFYGWMGKERKAIKKDGKWVFTDDPNSFLYDDIRQEHESAPIAVNEDGKWAFLMPDGQPSEFKYTDVRLFWGALVGVNEDGTQDVFGRYYSH